jgi:cytochrome P450
MDAGAKVDDPGMLLFGAETADAPHPAYALLRDRCPVARSPGAAMPGVYLSGYDEVTWALRNPDVFSSAPDALDVGQAQPLIPLQLDPPDHTRYRLVLNPLFKPKAVARLEPDVRALVAGLLDGIADRGRCDFHEEISTPLPSTIFLRLMGLPQSDLPQFLRWRDDVIRPDVAPGDVEGAARVREAAGQAINGYFESAIDRAQQQPGADDGEGDGDGLLGDLVGAELDGRPLDRSELLGICHLMLLGGLDTVTATLDCMVTYLARHPERRRALADDLSLVPAAVEELLRHQTPVMVVPRVVRQAITLRGVELQPGDPAVLVLGAANSDDAVFADAGELDLGRGASRHVAFGVGHHFCLGAHLARLELRVTLEELHRRIPDYRIPDDAEIHFSPGIRQTHGLPLEWEPNGAAA